MMTPMKTVQPIMVPWMRQAHRKAGCRKSGSGRKSSFQKVSSDLRPVKTARDWRKECFFGISAGRAAAVTLGASGTGFSEDVPLSPSAGSGCWWSSRFSAVVAVASMSVLSEASRRYAVSGTNK